MLAIAWRFRLWPTVPGPLETEPISSDFGVTARPVRGARMTPPTSRRTVLVAGGAAALPPGRGAPGWRLGEDAEGTVYFGVTAPLPAVEGAEPAGLRQVGALLADRDSGLLTHAVALEHWHATHRFCPRCGTGTRVASAGHVRVCPADDLLRWDGRERTAARSARSSDGCADLMVRAEGASWQ
ncbi:hypothetical protein KLI87_06150 [Actinomadura sp. NEAU-AAG7]|nr:hypothetical protein [Actinomadura sp. NEAU-AAG7]